MVERLVANQKVREFKPRFPLKMQLSYNGDESLIMSVFQTEDESSILSSCSIKCSRGVIGNISVLHTEDEKYYRFESCREHQIATVFQRFRRFALQAKGRWFESTQSHGEKWGLKMPKFVENHHFQPDLSEPCGGKGLVLRDTYRKDKIAYTSHILTDSSVGRILV